MRCRGRMRDWMPSVGDPLLNSFTRTQFEVPGIKL